ncbi:MAG: tetratricopeptide repeat protein [Deltaproteobacteria bacterium]|nr:tetratricopeptide repeat protein [Deltaproteobacteria bacterium]MBW1995314.1 tetratricopeptide repeat protein [Deltaproteobacteria bacterium]
MDAVTYPKQEVIDFIGHHVIPLRIPSDAQPLASDFNVKWTPALVVLDAYGRGHQQTVGFFPPEELIPSILLGIAKVHFDQGRFEDALANLQKLRTEYPASGATPEAIYFQGVSRYKHTNDAKALKEAYEQLKADFPQSEWTKRAYPYRLL